MEKFDERDAEILAERIAAWDAVSGPRVGDFCKLLDGSLRRFTHDWGDSLQTSCAGMCAGDQSFYFGKGYMSFSGSLDSAIAKDKFAPMAGTQDGGAWFFHHDWPKAHSGVTVKVPCRVYAQVQS